MYHNQILSILTEFLLNKTHNKYKKNANGKNILL